MNNNREAEDCGWDEIILLAVGAVIAVLGIAYCATNIPTASTALSKGLTSIVGVVIIAFGIFLYRKSVTLRKTRAIQRDQIIERAQCWRQPEGSK
jgi:hydrogenase-4 membrane subunit HyfE